MSQIAPRTAPLAAAAVMAGALAMISACSKAETQTTATTTTVAAAQPHPTLVPPPPPAINASSDLSQTAAVSPPGEPNGRLPPTPGERETLAAARQEAPR